MLGRSPSDPLVLMIARGPAGYRFAIKALQHAIPDVRVVIGEVEYTGQAEACVVPLWLSGQLRGTGSAVDVVRPSLGRCNGCRHRDASRCADRSSDPRTDPQEARFRDSSQSVLMNR